MKTIGNHHRQPINFVTALLWGSMARYGAGFELLANFICAGPLDLSTVELSYLAVCQYFCFGTVAINADIDAGNCLVVCS